MAFTEQSFSDEFIDDIEAHRPGLLRAAFRQTRNPEAAEDLVQDTLERAWHKRRFFEPGTNLKAWLYKIQYHAHISNIRRNQIHTSPLDESSFKIDLAMSEHSAEDEALSQIGYEALTATINGLPPHLQEVAAPALIEGQPYATISKALNLPLGTIASRLSRGRSRVAEKLQSSQSR